MPNFYRLMKSIKNSIGVVLNENYVIIKKLGEGAYSSVYKVLNPETNEMLAMKVINKYCKNEMPINRKLSAIQSPYIIKYLGYSQGDIKIENNKDYKSYFLFELANKGELSNYINCGKNGLSEGQTKLIFCDILKGFHEIHKAEICHRDIKAENILLNTDDYNIKISDFGFSADSSELLDGIYGTQQYMAPEIIMDKEYDGIKADIFSLGVLLFYIRTSKFLFEQAKTNTAYDYIKNNKKKIWKIAETNGIDGLSKEFKDLFLQMVAFNPNQRPTIQEILNGEWMKEIINLSEDEFKKKRQELTKELKKREDKILLQKE